MCLFPFLPMTTFVPPTSKSAKCVTQLRTLMYVQLFLAILVIFLGFYTFIDGMGGIFELFACCLLYMAYTQLSYCHCMIYVAFSTYSLVVDFVILGKAIQNGNELFSDKKPINGFASVVHILRIIFYLIATYFAFQAYKEFKALTMEMGGTFLPQSDRTYSDEFHQDYRPPQQSQQTGNYRPVEQTYQMQNTGASATYNSNPSGGGGKVPVFQGTGIPIGGN